MTEITSTDTLVIALGFALVVWGCAMYFVGKRKGRLEYEKEIEEVARTIDLDSVLPVLNDLMGLVAGHIRASTDPQVTNGETHD